MGFEKSGFGNLAGAHYEHMVSEKTNIHCATECFPQLLESTDLQDWNLCSVSGKLHHTCLAFKLCMFQELWMFKGWGGGGKERKASEFGRKDKI